MLYKYITYNTPYKLLKVCTINNRMKERAFVQEFVSDCPKKRHTQAESSEIESSKELAKFKLL